MYIYLSIYESIHANYGSNSFLLFFLSSTSQYTCKHMLDRVMQHDSERTNWVQVVDAIV